LFIKWSDNLYITGYEKVWGLYMYRTWHMVINQLNDKRDEDSDDDDGGGRDEKDAESSTLLKFST